MWNKEDDENSYFFHGVLKPRRHIQGVLAYGMWINDPQGVKMNFSRFLLQNMAI